MLKALKSGMGISWAISRLFSSNSNSRESTLMCNRLYLWVDSQFSWNLSLSQPCLKWSRALSLSVLQSVQIIWNFRLSIVFGYILSKMSVLLGDKFPQHIFCSLICFQLDCDLMFCWRFRYTFSDCI